MAKNTLSTAYRKINVDEFSEDKFEEDAVDDASQGPNESEVSGMLAQYPFKPHSITCSFSGFYRTPNLESLTPKYWFGPQDPKPWGPL